MRAEAVDHRRGWQRLDRMAADRLDGAEAKRGSEAEAKRARTEGAQGVGALDDEQRWRAVAGECPTPEYSLRR